MPGWAGWLNSQLALQLLHFDLLPGVVDAHNVKDDADAYGSNEEPHQPHRYLDDHSSVSWFAASKRRMTSANGGTSASRPDWTIRWFIHSRVLGSLMYRSMSVARPTESESSLIQAPSRHSSQHTPTHFECASLPSFLSRSNQQVAGLLVAQERKRSMRTQGNTTTASCFFNPGQEAIFRACQVQLHLVSLRHGLYDLSEAGNLAL